MNSQPNHSRRENRSVFGSVAGAATVAWLQRWTALALCGLAPGALAQGLPPRITQQPASQLVVAGADVTFSVGVAQSITPLRYQWQANTVPINGATNASLVFTNVQRSAGGDYNVVVANAAGSVTSSNATLIVVQVLSNQSVSLGADATFSAAFTFSSRGDATLQWRLNGADLPGATNLNLTLTNVQLTNAGVYSAVLTHPLGTAELSATLHVDPTFTKITTGPVVTDSSGSESACWADFDNDGNLDLVVANSIESGTTYNAFYQNQGDGTFVRNYTNAIATAPTASWATTAGDYNNDGNVDLFAAHIYGVAQLFRNEGHGQFTGMTRVGPLVTDAALSEDAAWADYDGDGFLDLFTANGFHQALNDCLYRNGGNGSFTKMTAAEVGPLVSDGLDSTSCAWADYDNDGWPDLWVGTSSGANYLYRNDGNGRFSSTTNSGITSISRAGSGAWGDYDNDGFLDLYQCGWGGPNALHHNLGGAAFTNVTVSAGLATSANSWGAAWGDYDNDGWLDLFVPRYSGGTSALFRNQGDGTFRSVDVGNPIRDGDRRASASWADYDNDGFLDLFIACGDAVSRYNYLYHNNGNSNNWLKVKLTGKASNASAIGAKVRAKATIRGQTLWQLREINGNSGMSGGTPGFIAHFGLGDATNVDVVRIEWPSGIVQELTDVATNQFLTVPEAGAGIRPRWQELVVGSNLTFHASTTLTSPVTYQWQRYGTNLVGETNVTLTIPNAQVADAGEYTVTVSTADGAQSQTSFPALLTLPGPPIIRVQPQSQIVAAGSDVKFTVDVLPSSTPLSYQWYVGSSRVGANSASLVLTDVLLGRGGEYSVVVTNLAGSVTSAVAGLTVVQDQSVSASPGADLTLKLRVGGPPAMSVLWHFNDADIPGATNLTQTLTNVGLVDVGQYSVVVTNLAGSVTVFCPPLLVDPTFTKTTSGPVVTVRRDSRNGAWADYNQDGGLDLFVSGNSPNPFRLNNKDSTFRIATTNEVGSWIGSFTRAVASWGDYNNDGWLDLLTGGGDITIRLLRNLQDGTMTDAGSAEVGDILSNSVKAGSFVWADFNNDGYLDVFSAGLNNPSLRNYLFTNDQTGRFTQVTNGALVTELSRGLPVAVSDYDNDGYPDLLAGNWWNSSPHPPTMLLPPHLWHSNGDGTFGRITNSPILMHLRYTVGAAWGDYDNDGHQDLFITDWSKSDASQFGPQWGRNGLFRNDGGVFTEVTEGPIPNEGGLSFAAGWGDYDNDGFLDLFVANMGSSFGASTVKNFLYHNNGDGTFTKVITGSLVNDLGAGNGVSWADYDGDGFLDLFVANRNGVGDFLYHNNGLGRGNTNGWIIVNLRGKVSNSFGVGAKVRVRAHYRGQDRQQLREMFGGDGYDSGPPLYAHFGLGDATNVDVVRIEWPSGIVQQLPNVATNQFLTVTEQGVGILPRKQLALAGSNYTFRAATTLAGPVNYQWRLGTNDLAGETNATLSITGAQRQDTGEYSVLVSNGTESMTSEPVALYWPEPPVITQQPKSQIVVAGTDVKFTVAVALNPVPATFQWQQNTYDLAGATNTTLLLTNVQTAKGGNYTVVVSNPAGSVTNDAAGLTVVQDNSVSASLGGNVTLRLRIGGPPPASYQWQFNGKDIAGATNATLSIKNAQLADVGDYSVVVANAAGSVVSHAPALVVNPTFTKITQGPIVKDQEGSAIGAAWGDFDNDGQLDLYVPNWLGTGPGAKDSLYRNLGGDEFARVTNAVTAPADRSWSGLWGDYDNDGRIDLFVIHGWGEHANALFHNQGDGVFRPVACAATTMTRRWADGGWIDLDRDGWLDLMVTTFNGKDSFFHNQGDGTFMAWTTNEVGPVLAVDAWTYAASWCDVDNDGNLDLYVANYYGANFLYRNNGTGRLEPITAGSLPGKSATVCALWGDFNNDGLYDLFTTSEDRPNTLHLNRGNWQFEDVTVASGLALSGTAYGPTAGDYDNDGNLDLYVSVYSGKDVLYHNNGDGTFSRVDVGSPLTDGTFDGAVWVDYNNDGFLDLFKTDGDGAPAVNLLYRNSLQAAGNTNHWLKVQLKGTVSNRSAIGAQLRVRTTIRGRETWQVRQIMSTGFAGGARGGLLAHFGLGDATNVDLLRIEWPSGTVQELHDVAPNQFLTVTEPPGLAMPRSGELQVTAWSNMTHRIDASTDLVQWTPLVTVTNQARTLNFTDPEAANLWYRFYRAVTVKP